MGQLARARCGRDRLGTHGGDERIGCSRLHCSSPGREVSNTRRRTGTRATGAVSVGPGVGLLVANAIIYWNTIYTQLALDDLPRAPADDKLAGLTPTLFEHVHPPAPTPSTATGPPPPRPSAPEKRPELPLTLSAYFAGRQ